MFVRHGKARHITAALVVLLRPRNRPQVTSLEELAKLCPDFDWPAYFAAAGKPKACEEQ